MSGLTIYEDGSLLDFKLSIYMPNVLCLFLNVVKNTSLVFISFLILCRDIKKYCRDIFAAIN